MRLHFVPVFSSAIFTPLQWKVFIKVVSYSSNTIYLIPSHPIHPIPHPLLKKIGSLSTCYKKSSHLCSGKLKTKQNLHTSVSCCSNTISCSSPHPIQSHPPLHKKKSSFISIRLLSAHLSAALTISFADNPSVTNLLGSIPTFFQNEKILKLFKSEIKMNRFWK